MSSTELILLGLRTKIEELSAVTYLLEGIVRGYIKVHHKELPSGILIDNYFDQRGVTLVFDSNRALFTHFISLETLAEFEAQKNAS